MQTTGTLDEPVAAKVHAQAHRSGQSFQDVVNDALRCTLSARDTQQSREPFDASDT